MKHEIEIKLKLNADLFSNIKQDYQSVLSLMLHSTLDGLSITSSSNTIVVFWFTILLLHIYISPSAIACDLFLEHISKKWEFCFLMTLIFQSVRWHIWDYIWIVTYDSYIRRTIDFRLVFCNRNNKMLYILYFSVYYCSNFDFFGEKLTLWPGLTGDHNSIAKKEPVVSSCSMV